MKKAIEANDYEGMKTKSEILTTALHAISAKLYQQQEGQGGPEGFQQHDHGSAGGGGAAPGGGGGDGGDGGDTVVDADFEIKD